MSSAPELVSINGQWHVIHRGRSLENHAERGLADAALERHTLRIADQATEQGWSELEWHETTDDHGKPMGALMGRPPVATVDLAAILAVKVPLLIERLATGELDDMVPALIAAEQAKTKPRKSALRVLRARLG